MWISLVRRFMLKLSVYFPVNKRVYDDFELLNKYFAYHLPTLFSLGRQNYLTAFSKMSTASSCSLSVLKTYVSRVVLISL